MSRNMTTMGKIVLGPGHVIEDKNPIPIALRKTVSNPPVVKSVPIPSDPPTPKPIP